MNAARGFLYQCHGANFARWCYHSIRSVRAWGGKAAALPVLVNWITPDAGNEWPDRIAAIPSVKVKRHDLRSIHPGLDKFGNPADRVLRLKMLASMPFEVTLRLDADTLVLADPSALFEHAAAHGLGMVIDGWYPWRSSVLPEGVDPQRVWQFNGGVMAVTREAALALAVRMRYYIAQGWAPELHVGDQPLLNTACAQMGYHTDKHSLPRCWNMAAFRPETAIFHQYGFARQNKALHKVREAVCGLLDRQEACPAPTFGPGGAILKATKATA